ncbi:three-helix bundle dimerization domain-containing protein [Krasilnikovia sp. MM14-A1259]|uniref:three-helix bundle dimerization domain-containing protein n=1 Tax=Krasilnikovia sp. MM14-A1259 TaxID=3373539 RepID=UPI0037F7F68A
MSDEAAQDAERQAVRQIVNVLQHRFPSLTDRAVAEHVNGVHQRYASAPIRDFVPLLVEREAGRELTALADQQAAAPRPRESS